MSGFDPGAWALRYAAGGLAVLPLHSVRDGRCTCRKPDCGSAGKHPLTPHGKDDATAATTRITEWWDRWPWANVGIRPPAGAIVLDVDPRNGGAVALLDLTRQHGQLPRTLTARTGSGGLHIWLAYAGRTRGQLCRGVDVKSNGGYVVAPPSLHASGQRYEWVTELPTVPAPHWVRRELDPPRPPLSVPRSVPGGQLDALVRYVATAPEGELNSRLYWATCRAHEGGLDTRPLVDAPVAAGHPPRGAANTAAGAAKAPPREVVRR